MAQTIQQLLDIIDQRLDSPLTATELAEQAGYSTFYFYRLFQREVGMPVMQYITRRKLMAALADIAKGMSITEAGLKYGFAPHSGFFRAFVKEYGIAPTDYLANHPLPSQHRIQLKKERYKFMHINQLKKLLSQWSLKETEVAPVYQPNGDQLSEHVWQVGSAYYLKLFSSIEAVQKELALVSQAGSAQDILSADSGLEYVEAQGNYFVLFRKDVGSPLLSADPLAHPEQGRYIGEIIGQLSLQLAEVAGDFPENHLLENLTHWALPACQSLELPAEWLTDFQARVTQLFPELPRQLIHRDLNGGNLLVENGRFTPIDFELAEINYRIYDPCYYLTSVLSEQFNKPTFSGEH